MLFRSHAPLGNKVEKKSDNFTPSILDDNPPSHTQTKGNSMEGYQGRKDIILLDVDRQMDG